MGNLIKAEFRKILTTKLWWALLIPTALLALGFSLGWGAVLNSALTNEDIQELGEASGVDPSTLPGGVLAIGHGVNMGLLFPVILGVFALAGEYSKKTISTTFLTAPNRGLALSAKMITYIAWGAIYGIVIVAFASLGIAMAMDSNLLPDGSVWLGILGTGILASILATLFGIGLGALWNSVVGSLITVIIYMVVIEPLLLVFAFSAGGVTWLGGVLPNGTLDSITGSVGAEIFGAAGVTIPGLDEEAKWGAQYLSGAPGGFSWWASALIFLAWTLLFFGGGWAANQRRDIT